MNFEHILANIGYIFMNGSVDDILNFYKNKNYAYKTYTYDTYEHLYLKKLIERDDLCKILLELVEREFDITVFNYKYTENGIWNHIFQYDMVAMNILMEYFINQQYNKKNIICDNYEWVCEMIHTIVSFGNCDQIMQVIDIVGNNDSDGVPLLFNLTKLEILDE